MNTITFPEELYVWAYEMDGKAREAVEVVEHLLGASLTCNQWSLMMLCVLEADRHLTAEPKKRGVRLESTRQFERKFKVKIKVLLPHEAFARYPNKGRDHLMFQWRKA